MKKLLREVIGSPTNQDPGEFQSLAISLIDRLYRTALILTGNSSKADNLVFDTYVNAWGIYQRLRPETNFDLWMFRVLISMFAERYKSKVQEGPLVNRQLAAQTRGDGSAGEGNKKLNAEPVESDEELLDAPFISALLQLPEPCRDVVLYSDVGELGHEEIADLLNCRIDSVKAHLHRGRVLLARVLKLHPGKRLAFSV
ncbi:MAG: RNA polymerase sigma factor [Bacteroidota bacterium]